VKRYVYVYRYLVTASEHPDVPVGTPLVDHKREHTAVWDFLGEDGVIRQVVGRRGPRICSDCHQMKFVREYDHPGEHGKDALYVPWPTDEEIAEVTGAA
jgi:hypothetical protein